MADPRTLRNKTRLASLGLSDESIKAINEKISMAKKLKDDFSAIQENDNIVSTDILFVNAEVQSSMEYYDKIRSHVAAVPVFVYKQREKAELLEPALKKYPNARTLKVPVTLGRLCEVLFDVTLTKKEVAVVGGNAEPSQAPQDKPDVFKVLVVDDSFPVRKYLENKIPQLIAEIDSNIKFTIQFADSGQESVSKVKSARGDYDMVFLDIMMEDANGYQVCKWIKKVKRSVNVVMLTSKSSIVDRVRGNLAGCDSYISKPPKDVELIKVIRNHSKFQEKQKHKMKSA